MKHYILFIVAILSCLTGFAQGGYNPENPGDPNPIYRLDVLAAPSRGGDVSPKLLNVEVGTTVSCVATPKTGYEFSRWMIGDSVVSLNSEFDFKMPAHSEVLTAHFDYKGYDPQNPGDPFADGFHHKVTLYASPSFGGYFSESVFYLKENERSLVYAWSYDDYSFIGWYSDNELISTSNPMEIQMGKENRTFTAKFSYSPQNPIDPSSYVYDKNEDLVKVYSSRSKLISSLPTEVTSNSYDAYGIIFSGIIGLDDLETVAEIANHYQLIDLKSTNGLTVIPSSILYSSRLEKLILPEKLEYLDKNCFYECKNLREIHLYSKTPPKVIGDSISNNHDLIVRVPAQSLQQYKYHEVFGQFTILPLTDEMAYVVVNLPDIVATKPFVNSKISLKNQTTGQTISYNLGKKTTYTFSNLLKNQTYSLEIKTNSGASLSVPQTLYLDDNKTIEINELKTPIDIRLHLTNTDGAELTEGYDVLWYDESGNHLSTGLSLSDRIEGECVRYQISLMSSLYPLYLPLEPCNIIVSDSEKDIFVRLANRLRKTVTGKITGENNIPIANALIDIKQTYSDFTTSFSCHTDNAGVFSIEIPKYHSVMNVICAGFATESIELSDSQTKADFSLKYGSVCEISIDIPTKGTEDETKSKNIDMSDLEVHVINKSTNKVIQDFLFENGHILFESGVVPGNILEISVSSQSDSFNTIVQNVTIPQKGYCSITLEPEYHNSIELNYSNFYNSDDIALLYDAEGLLRRQEPLEEKTVFQNVPNGRYHIVCMNNNLDIPKMLRFSNLESLGYVCEKDYLMFEVEMTSQKDEEIKVGQIPDISIKQQLVDPSYSLTKISAPKSTVGSMLTLSVRYKLIQENMSESSDYSLVIEIPDNFVIEPNSLISKNKSDVEYDIEDNTIIIRGIQNEETYKLCLTPVSNGRNSINTYISDNLNRKHVLGNVEISVADASINFRNYTADSNILIHGNAVPGSEVDIIYNGSTVCKTMSGLNGLWNANFNIVPDTCAQNGTISAKIILPTGNSYNTERRIIKYDPSFPTLKSLQMIYDKDTFDFLNGISGKSYYSYAPSDKNTFIFKASFSDNSYNPLDLVTFQILCSDGRVRSLEAIYDKTSDEWVASCLFNNSSALPINLNIDYKMVQDEPSNSYYSEQETYKSFFKNIVDFQTDYDVDDVNVISDSDEALIFSYKVSNYESLYFRLRTIEKSELKKNIDIEDTSTMDIEFSDETFNMQFGENATLPTLYIWNKENAFILDMSPDLNDLKETLPRTAATSKNDVEKKLKLMKWYQDNESLHTFTYSNHLVPATLREMAELERINTVYNEEINKMLYKYNKLGWISDLEKNQYEAELEHLQELYRKPDPIFDALAYKVPATAIELSKYMEMQELKYGSISKCLIMAGGILNHKINLLKPTPKNEICGASIKKLANGYVQYTYAGFNFSHEVDTYEFNPLGLKNGLTFKNCSWQIIRGNNKLPKLLPHTLFPKVSTNKKLREFHKSLRNKKHAEQVKCEQLDVIEKTVPFNKKTVEPIIDPSGYVYEGTPSNRLEGVKATVYYQTTEVDENGVVSTKEVPWIASQYGHENPIYTDENGMYSWDVPKGLWQVKFEKEGYETAYSDWLPVPPPQLDVNIGMVQLSQPEVKTVQAYADGIVVEFDKYMVTSTLNSENIIVKIANETVSGRIILQNEDKDITESLSMTKKLRFEPDNSFKGKTVELTISDLVTSYAGIKMAEPFTKELAIEPEIKTIIVPDEISISAGEQVSIEISVLPADAAKDKILVVDSSSPAIAHPEESELTINEAGQVNVIVSGMIPGSTYLSFIVKDYDASKKIQFNVLPAISSDVVATPVASVESGIVNEGTEIYLSCDTQNSSIFYTLDGTSPIGENRILYTGAPIIITRDTILKVIAEAEGMIKSEIAEYQYTVKSAGVEDLNIDETLSIYPLPLGEYLNISNGDHLIDSVSIFDLSGTLMMHSNKQEKLVTLKTGSLSSGLYILNIKTDGQTIVKKVVKQ